MLKFFRNQKKIYVAVILSVLFVVSTTVSALTVDDLTTELAGLETKAQTLQSEILKAKDDPQTTTDMIEKFSSDVVAINMRASAIKNLLITAPPDPIIRVETGASCGGSISLFYTAPVNGTVLNYELNRNPDGNQLAQWGAIQQGTDSKIFPLTDTSIKPDTIYKYQLRAIGPGEVEAYSDIVQAKSSMACPPSPPAICTPPLTQNVTAVCDINADGDTATSGLVTRSQVKSAPPSCEFPASPVTNINSIYVSDDCVYPTPTPTTYELQVTVAGNGTVTSDPTGINCNTNDTCRRLYPHGASITLSAFPAGGYRFATWSRECGNMEGDCVIIMNGSKKVTASFFLIPSLVGTGGSGATTITTTTGGATGGIIIDEGTTVEDETVDTGNIETETVGNSATPGESGEGGALEVIVVDSNAPVGDVSLNADQDEEVDEVSTVSGGAAGGGSFSVVEEEREVSLVDSMTIAGLLQKLKGILNAVIPFIIGLTVLVIIWGIFTYVTEAANEEKRTEAKQFILYGIIGLFCMLSIWGLVNILVGTFSLTNKIEPGQIPTVPTIIPIQRP